jgi:hypothetical protein
MRGRASAILLKEHKLTKIGYTSFLLLLTLLLAGCNFGSQNDLIGSWTSKSLCDFKSDSDAKPPSFGTIDFFDNGHAVYTIAITDDTYGGEYFVMSDKDNYVELDTKQANFVFSYSVSGNTLKLYSGSGTSCDFRKS